MTTEIFQELGMGTRMRRLLSRLSVEGDRIYAAHGFDVGVSDFPVLYPLALGQSPTISALAEGSGFTVSALSQRVKKLGEAGYVRTETAEDGRSRRVVPTAAGEALIARLQPLWRRWEAVLVELMAESGIDLLAALDRMERSVRRRPLADRIEAAAPPFAIEPWHVRWADAFRDLNLEWVERYFEVEALDLQLLEQPEAEILSKGGEIWFAVRDGVPIGTVAMKPHGNGRFELTKLAVAPAAQGTGAGKALCLQVMERYLARGGTTLFLETNNVLGPANALYDRLGWTELPFPEPSDYARADRYMEWRPAP